MIKNTISRRSALKISASGALVATSGFVGVANAATPKRGGTLRVALSGGSATDNFDPAKNTGVMKIYMSNFSNRLIKEKSDTGELVAELATSWQASNQNKNWVLKLRKGVKFHDGSTFTAKDAAYTINWHLDDKSKSPVKTYFTSIPEVKIIDNYTIKLVFEQPEPDLPSILSIYKCNVMKDGHSDFSKSMGTGPYIIESFNPGVKIVMKRFDDFWNADNSAWADKIELIYINDKNSMLNAFLGGQVDLVDIDTKTARKLEGMSKVNVVKSAGKRHATMPMISEIKPFDDNNVRMALKHCIERQKIIENAMDGYGSVGYDNPISSSYSDYVPVKGAEYDIDKAKYYLKKAGHSKLNISYSASNAATGTRTEEFGIIMAESARKAGINIKVIREPGDGYWASVWKKKPFSASFWVGRPTALMQLKITYHSTAKANESRFKSVKFDKLLAAAATASSASTKKDLLGEAQQVLTSTGSVIIPAFQVWMEASMNNRIGGHKSTVSMPFNNHYLDEYWIK